MNEGGAQGIVGGATNYFKRSISIAQSHNDLVSIAFAKGFQGFVALKWAELAVAEHYLGESIAAFRRWPDKSEMPLLLNWWGMLNEAKRDYQFAQNGFEECIGLKKTGRIYWHAGALTGLVRVEHAQGDYAAIAPLFAEAEQLAQQYEYNDHLASLRLTQAMLAWEGITTDKIEINGQTSASASPVQSNQSVVIGFFKQAMIYALRYNRFLLYEVLSGRPQGTPLRPIIPYCLARGEEGRRVLIALRDWWQTGGNDIGAPRPDTISPIPEGIALLEAEGIAREREPGDGSPQRSVVEQIEAALRKTGAG